MYCQRIIKAVREHQRQHPELYLQDQHGPNISYGHLYLCIVGLLLWLLQEMAFATESQTRKKQTNEQQARLAASSWIVDAPTKMAAGNGWFNESDRRNQNAVPEVVLVHAASGQEAVQLLLDDEAEFALAASTPVAKQLVSGYRHFDDQLLVLASIGLSTRSHYVLVNATSDIEHPQDMAGKTIGVMKGSSAHYGWAIFTRFYGLEDKVKLVDYHVSEAGEALADGELDAAVIWEPWGSQARERLGNNVRKFSLRPLYSVNWLLVTKKSVIDSHPDLAKRILKGYLKAEHLMHDSLTGSLQWHANAIGLSVDKLVPLSVDIAWHLGIDWGTLTNMTSQMQWLLSLPEFQQNTLPDPVSYIYATPLMQVAPERMMLSPVLVCTTSGVCNP